MKTFDRNIKENESEITINIALTFCNRSPAPKGAADCALCPFSYDCTQIKRAKQVFKMIVFYGEGREQ